MLPCSSMLFLAVWERYRLRTSNTEHCLNTALHQLSELIIIHTCANDITCTHSLKERCSAILISIIAKLLARHCVTVYPSRNQWPIIKISIQIQITNNQAGKEIGKTCWCSPSPFIQQGIACSFRLYFKRFWCPMHVCKVSTGASIHT